MEPFDFKINHEKIDEYALHAKDWCLVNGKIHIYTKKYPHFDISLIIT